MSPEVASKAERLAALLGSYDSLAVAFSGGVDSSVLLHAGTRALGSRCAGVIADSPSLPREELAEARAVAAGMGAELVEVRTEELADPRYVANAGDRCYYCKSALFEVMQGWAEAQGFAVLAFGEITDDALDDRPGARAAAEFRVRAPLSEAGFSEEDVRAYAREHGLPVAEKPASACLASRLPVGTTVTAERLAQVEAAEAALRRLGLSVLRVRHHGTRALLEVGEAEYEAASLRLPELALALEAGGFETFELGVYIPPSERGR